MGIRDHFSFKRLLKKDKKAWDAFVERFSGVIYASVLKVFTLHTTNFNFQDTEEVIQDVFLRLIKDDFNLLKSYKPSKASLVTWLTVISRSMAIDFLRRRKITPLPLEKAAEIAVEPQAASGSGINLPRGILSERQKLILHLFFDKNMRTEEIAGLLGVKVQTVRSSKHKALEKLRSFYKSKG